MRTRAHQINRSSSLSWLETHPQPRRVSSCGLRPEAFQQGSTLNEPDAGLGGYSLNVARSSRTIPAGRIKVHNLSAHQEINYADTDRRVLELAVRNASNAANDVGETCHFTPGHAEEKAIQQPAIRPAVSRSGLRRRLCEFGLAVGREFTQIQVALYATLHLVAVSTSAQILDLLLASAGDRTAGRCSRSCRCGCLCGCRRRSRRLSVDVSSHGDRSEQRERYAFHRIPLGCRERIDGSDNTELRRNCTRY
jgi:hypothetical protein